MACTRNKSFIGNFEAEEIYNNRRIEQTKYLGGTLLYAGNGLLSNGKICATHLSTNSIDIESDFRGLFQNVINNTTIVPKMNTIKTLSLYERDEIIYPAPLTIVSNNRPCPWQMK
jgi:hypothetical protein